MSREISPSTDRPYGVKRVAEEFGVSRSAYYERKAASQASPSPPKKRGPKTKLDDSQLTEAIRAVLADSLFPGAEGHRKAWARLRAKGIRTSLARVLRLMREANLLCPPTAKRVLGPKEHNGTIVTDAPDLMWGTDATSTYTLEDGHVTVFLAVEHFNSECVGIHVAKEATRHEALEPIYQGVRDHFGTVEEAVGSGLKLRHDHGSQYMSDDFQDTIRFLGIESSPSFVRAPEGNGVAERMGRTLKEQLLWLKTLRNVEELRLALHEWRRTYNENWLVARHGYRTPAQVRREALTPLAVAV